MNDQLIVKWEKLCHFFIYDLCEIILNFKLYSISGQKHDRNDPSSILISHMMFPYCITILFFVVNNSSLCKVTKVPILDPLSVMKISSFIN